MNLTRDQIIALEQSDHKYVRAKKIYIDMAGDLIAGIVLSEIVYWHTPGKGGKQRLRAIEGQSDKWLACRRQSWWERARITARQFDRALDKLVQVGLIIREHFDYKGQSTLHVRISWDVFEELYNKLLEAPAPRKRRTGVTKKEHPQEVLPTGDTLSPSGNTDLPTGETDSPHGDTYTIIDTTIDTTTNTTKLSATNADANSLFDAVSEHIFKILPSKSNGNGGRIGTISSWLAGKSDGMKRTGGKVGFISSPAKPEHVKAFADYWKVKYPNANIPLDFIKFVEAWRAWASSLKQPKVITGIWAHTDAPELPTPMSKEEREAFMAEWNARKVVNS